MINHDTSRALLVPAILLTLVPTAWDNLWTPIAELKALKSEVRPRMRP